MKFKEVQDRLQIVDSDLKNNESRNEFGRRFNEVIFIIDEHDSQNREQSQPTDASEHPKFTQHHEAASNKVA